MNRFGGMSYGSRGRGDSNGFSRESISSARAPMRNSAATFSKPATFLDPSKVVFIGEILANTSEMMLRRELQDYGRIESIFLIPHKRQALVMFSYIEDAETLVNLYNSGNPVYIRNEPVVVNFSKSTDIRQPKEEYLSLEPTRHLLITIFNVVHDVNCETIKKICSQHGRVERIIIFKFTYLRALVEFSSIEEATLAKPNLNGADIYANANTLRVDYCTVAIFDACSREPIIDEWAAAGPMRSGYQDRGSAASGGGLLDEPVPSRGGMIGRDQYRSRSPPIRERSPIRGGRRDYRDEDYARGAERPFAGRDRDRPTKMDYGNLFQVGLNNERRRFPDQDRDVMPGARGQHSAAPEHRIILISNMSKKMNCDKLFNILSLYGNVARIKFLIGKEGTAMVEMFTAEHAMTAAKFLDGEIILDSAFRVQISHQLELKGVQNPANLEDGTISIKDFSTGPFRKRNRFLTQEAARKNRPIRPSKCVYVWGMTEACTEENVRDHLENVGASQPQSIDLAVRKAKTAVLSFAKVSEAIDCITLGNNSEITEEEKGEKIVRVIKMCFSGDPSNRWPSKKD